MTADAMPVAQQARSRQTQERILEAAFGLIAVGGVDALTISAIADRAGVAVGSVYRRFGDKDRLLLAVQQEFAERVRDDVTAHLSLFDPVHGHSAEAVIAHAVDALVRTFHTHEAVLRVFLVLGMQNPAIYEAGSRASIESNHVVATFLAGINISHEDRAGALDFAFRMLYATLAHRVTQGEHLESNRKLPWSRLRTQLTVAVSAYLLAPTP